MSDHVCIIPHPSPRVGSSGVSRYCATRGTHSSFIMLAQPRIGIRKHQLSRVTGPFTNNVLSSPQWFLVTQPQTTQHMTLFNLWSKNVFLMKASEIAETKVCDGWCWSLQSVTWSDPVTPSVGAGMFYLLSRAVTMLQPHLTCQLEL